MCGLAAIFRNSAITIREIEKIINFVAHRGPDGKQTKLLFENRIAFGHARLAIQDTSNIADQPMASIDGRYTIIFNGEIYNYRELRSQLSNRGYRFRTNSDTEVILAAYSDKGIDCLNDFNGMWAFLLHDAVTNKCIFSRDRYGVKPLYYLQDEDQLIVCSEIDAIDKFTGHRLAENRDYLNELVTGCTRSFGTNATHIQGIKSLPPGSIAVWMPQQTKFEIQRWYNLRRQSVPRRFSDQAHELRDLLLDACSLRLRSDVPVATCLSGGIDSGSIVCGLNALKAKGQNFENFSHRSFTATFPGSPLDESSSTRHIAKRNDITLDGLVISCPDPNEVELALSFCDGPMPTLAFYPIWRLYKHIKESGISVTLDGQGADEMLGGYYVGNEALLSAWQSRNPLRLIDMYRTYSALHHDAANWMKTAVEQTRQYATMEFDQTLKGPVKKFASLIGLYHPGPCKFPTAPPPPEAINLDDKDAKDWLANKLWDQFFHNPLPFLLHQYDRCSMANGVECRMPFMDFRLVEFILSLPLSSRIGHGYTKRVLREAMKGLLPDEIRLNRTKTGFNAPFDQWTNGPICEWINDQVQSRQFRENSYFDGRTISQNTLRSKNMDNTLIRENDLWPKIHLAWWQNRRSANRQNSDSN